MAWLGLLIEAERKGKGTIASFQINQICSYRQLKSEVESPRLGGRGWWHALAC